MIGLNGNLVAREKYKILATKKKKFSNIKL